MSRRRSEAAGARFEGRRIGRVSMNHTRAIEGQDDGGGRDYRAAGSVRPAAAPPIVPGGAIRVRKLRPDGTERFGWDAIVLRADQTGVVVRAEFTLPLVDLGCTTFRRGDVFVEFYVWHRWYTVAQVSSADGTPKGWYCDVCMPPHLSAPGELSYADLALDLWCGADGTVVLLDEEEFAEQQHAGSFTPAQIEGAERGWAELRALAARGDLPRWP